VHRAGHAVPAFTAGAGKLPSQVWVLRCGGVGGHRVFVLCSSPQTHRAAPCGLGLFCHQGCCAAGVEARACRAATLLASGQALAGASHGVKHGVNFTPCFTVKHGVLGELGGSPRQGRPVMRECGPPGPIVTSPFLTTPCCTPCSADHDARPCDPSKSSGSSSGSSGTVAATGAGALITAAVCWNRARALRAQNPDGWGCHKPKAAGECEGRPCAVPCCSIGPSPGCCACLLGRLHLGLGWEASWRHSQRMHCTMLSLPNNPPPALDHRQTWPASSPAPTSCPPTA